MCKASVASWSHLGYESKCRLVRATAVGGLIHQSCLIVVRFQSTQGHEWTWDSLDRDPELVRPMSNLLTPPGLGCFHHLGHPSLSDRPDARTEHDGVRCLSIDEVAQGLGVPKASDSGLSRRMLERTTSVFHWEYLSGSLQNLKRDPHAPLTGFLPIPSSPTREPDASGDHKPMPVFSWAPRTSGLAAIGTTYGWRTSVFCLGRDLSRRDAPIGSSSDELQR
jgi:hypothetical protein